MSNGICYTCVQGYSVLNGSCLSWYVLYPYCSNFSMLGDCTKCVYGYCLINISCISAAVLNPNCASFNDTVCLICKDRYYIGNDGNCTKVSDLCTTYNISTGVCTGCVIDSLLIVQLCVSLKRVTNNPWCNQFNATGCISCMSRYYIGVNGICTVVTLPCLTYDMFTGYCLACWQGYALSGNTCAGTAANNPYCTNFIGVVCINCATRFYIGPDNICKPASQTCDTYNMSNGVCFSCYVSYSLVNGTCIRL